MTPLSKRDLETLGELAAANKNLAEVGHHRNGWAKPMDCGAWNGSHHSGTLTKLVRHGLVERRGYKPGTRAVWTYKITPAGQRALSAGERQS